MKKEKKKIMLGEEFVENKKMQQDYWTEFRPLESCYDRCSFRKINIYNYYYELLQKNTDRVISYGVRSFNTMIIVLHAIVEKDNKKLYLVITPSYNWFNEI